MIEGARPGCVSRTRDGHGEPSTVHEREEPVMAEDVRRGARVTWTSHSGTVEVASQKGGGTAVHTPSALEKD